ncbi:MAG: phosphoesterase [Desulfobulbus propionicus]|nr:MAG: phosphoesterase [Desulfobulbus propionicus]
MCIDLHMHSIHSDGTLAPTELVTLAASQGIKAVSLTDHDTMAGVSEAKIAGQNHNILVMNGVEVSARYDDISVHILGYGQELDNPAFNNLLKALQEGREERNKKVLVSLEKTGIPITREELDEVSSTGLTGRPHIATILMKKGVVKSFREAFDRYLGKGKKAWHSRFCYPAEETIAAIHGAGGAAVLAHPGHIDHSMQAQPAIIRKLAEYGLDGLEVIYPTHTRHMQAKLSELASRNHLLVTGGSDYHGHTRPANKMACINSSFCPSEKLLFPLMERIQTHSQ